ncbi:MAG: XRE family transcriptional regulator [Leifsonia xyli]|nr:MAG: XRE family transcriptional regulator [Leifsonia xyli]
MSAATAASSLSNRAIAEYAERVGVHHNVYSPSGRADVSELVAVLGGRVEESNALVAPEALTVYEPGRFTVHLPLVTSDRRDRFTIAHELGHYFLHYLYPKHESAQVFGRGERNRAETEANVFASSLLMPEQKFRDAVRAYGTDWWKVADVFGVSPSAASVRAQVLGID